ncbi:unnamed protein product [Linum trigynum]|uniref:Disease resistance protein RGA3 n=1 Tax=Linum trigynum TaxID=586398 RepID=A0AAV2F0B5_9ROSI
MAEAALFSIADAILNQLGSKILQEAALLWGIGDDVQKLTRTLSTIQALLLDAEEKSYSPRNHLLQLWLKELRQVFYDAEDLLDDFSTELRRRRSSQGTAAVGERIAREVRNFFSGSNQISHGLKIAHGIQAVRARLDEIAERREMFDLVERPVAEPAVRRNDRLQTHSGVPHVVVGREIDKERIVELLMSCDCKENVFTVVPIVGIGGLGKTTLAQLVYNDERVKSCFELAAWVCVSENFDVKLIVEKIVESCTGEKLGGNMEMDTLRKRLFESINGRRYLIVLDDVWNEDGERWSRLKRLLMGGAKGSCMIITTRLKKVAKIATRMEPYELKGLSKSQSWSLFGEIAFEGREAMSGKCESIGREIVEKCRGVPLAIKTIAGALLFKETEREWAAFRNKEMWEVNQNENDIMSTLKLSYDHLPTHLKHCFAYCRLFPKDYELNVKTLIELWIAQGYVNSSDQSSQFGVGLEYFKDLLWMSFFQEAKQDEWGYIKYCKMHDLMHDLAVAVAGEESLNLEIASSLDTRSYDTPLSRIRHVSLNFAVKFPEELCQTSSFIVNNAEKLRTLFTVQRPWFWDPKVYNPIIFSNTTRLRVLDLSYFGMTVVSLSIHKLKHLRYLDLSGNKMTMLPKEIIELVNLQVLMLRDCRFLERLPKDIGNLLNLAHLALGGCTALICMPLGIGRLRFLRELSIFVLPEGGIECSTAAAGIGELGYMNNISGELMIHNLERVKNLSEGEAANLKDKQHLDQLVLSWESGRDGVVNVDEKLLEALRPHPNLKVLSLDSNAGLKCPSWLPSITSLVEISIDGCQHWKHLPSLDHLPFLAKLELSSLYSLEYIDSGVKTSWASTSSSFFPSLKSLKLMGCHKLKGWSTPSELLPQFPCVSEVTINGCLDIISIPHFSLHLQSLTLIGGSKELLKQILKIIPSSPPNHLCSPPASHSSHLESVYVDQVLDLDTLPEELLPRLSSSLKVLSISDCPELRTLSPYLPHHLTSLQDLSIYGCEELDLCDHITIVGSDGSNDIMQQFHGVLLPSLSSVDFKGIPRLISLPDWLQLAPSLKKIETRDCPIASIPGWMLKLPEMESLEMRHCKKSVEECLAEDWPKISHIPTVIINKVCIKKDGSCQPLNEEVEEENPSHVIGWFGGLPEREEGEEREETSKLLQFLRNCARVLGTCCNISGDVS